MPNHNQPQSTLTLLRGIFGYLSHQRRLQLGLLLVLMLASGVAELLSLGAVFPFMAVLSDPQLLWRQSIIQELFIRLGFSSANQLLLPATFLFASSAVLAAIVRLSNLAQPLWRQLAQT